MDEAAVAEILALMRLTESAVLTAVAIFARVAAIAFFLPGLGERAAPVRVKLAAALAFTAIIWPLVPPAAVPPEPTIEVVVPLILAEIASGLMLGFGIRLMIFALQTAGTIAAQSLSLSQMFGGGFAPEPEPTIATWLMIAGVALAMTLGLHVKVALLLVESYATLPLGVFPLGSDVATWSTARVAQAFNIAVSFALPFILASFVYNLALGFINRAMPQLMVAFVGLPAITWIGISLFGLVSGAILSVWAGHLDDVLANPFAAG